jgi:hypothetical protein
MGEELVLVKLGKNMTGNSVLNLPLTKAAVSFHDVLFSCMVCNTYQSMLRAPF